MNGKGDTPRQQTKKEREKFESNFEKVFGKKKCQKNTMKKS